MVIFYSYVKLPEGNMYCTPCAQENYRILFRSFALYTWIRDFPVATFTGEYRPTGDIDQNARILDKSHCGLARRLKCLILWFHWLFGGRQNSPRSLASVNLRQTTGMGQWDWWTLHEQNVWKVMDFHSIPISTGVQKPCFSKLQFCTQTLVRCFYVCFHEISPFNVSFSSSLAT